MSQEPTNLSADAIEYITTVKFPAARAAVKLLRDAGVRVIHYGSLGNNDVKPELRDFFDLDLIVRMEDLDLFSATLEGAGYRMLLDNPHTGTAVEATPEWQEHERYAFGGCSAGYALPTKPVPDLWIHFKTTWQHWPLVFVDLSHWFDAAETVTVLGDTEIQRAPLWARLLWETDETAQEVRRHHPDARRDLDEVALFARAPGVDWDLVAERIVQYDAECVQRQTRLTARVGELGRTTVVAPIPDQKGLVIN